MEESNKDNKVNSTIDAVAGLIKAVPVYQDTLQPAAKEVGKALETIAKTVNIGLSPIKALVWGYEQIEHYVNTTVSNKLKNTSPANIVTPPIEVVGPALEAMRFTGQNEELRNLFANLIANSMDVQSKDKTHPSFVEVIKNLNSDEAKILSAFGLKESSIEVVSYFPIIDILEVSHDEGYLKRVIYKNASLISESCNCKNKELIPVYLDNLIRLRLLEIDDSELSDDDCYKLIIESNIVKEILKDYPLNDGFEYFFHKKCIEPTPFGDQFIKACVTNKA